MPIPFEDNSWSSIDVFFYITCSLNDASDQQVPIDLTRAINKKKLLTLQIASKANWLGSQRQALAQGSELPILACVKICSCHLVWPKAMQKHFRPALTVDLTRR
jgi:hypothetical protein